VNGRQHSNLTAAPPGALWNVSGGSLAPTTTAENGSPFPPASTRALVKQRGRAFCVPTKGFSDTLLGPAISEGPNLLDIGYKLLTPQRKLLQGQGLPERRTRALGFVVPSLLAGGKPAAQEPSAE